MNNTKSDLLWENQPWRTRLRKVNDIYGKRSTPTDGEIPQRAATIMLSILAAIAVGAGIYFCFKKVTPLMGCLTAGTTVCLLVLISGYKRAGKIADAYKHSPAEQTALLEKTTRMGLRRNGRSIAFASIFLALLIATGIAIAILLPGLLGLPQR